MGNLEGLDRKTLILGAKISNFVEGFGLYVKVEKDLVIAMFMFGI